MASISNIIAQPWLFLVLFFMFQVDLNCFFILNTTEVGNRVWLFYENFYQSSSLNKLPAPQPVDNQGRVPQVIK
jgi:hypothetical protein